MQNLDGRRFVGDSICEFKGNDLVLLGPNLPHMWRFKNIKNTSKVLVWQVKSEISESQVIGSFATNGILKMLRKSSGGILFKKSIIGNVSKLLHKIEKLKG